jgi:phage-related minor tail protein
MTETVLETLVVSVRADTQTFARDMRVMRGDLDGVLATGVDAAGRRMEDALQRFVRTGKFSFEDLRRTALSVLADIANAVIRASLTSLLGGAGGGGGGTGGLLSSLLTTVLGLPGRATGGLVTPGRAYRVGEMGPEVFVPQAAGRIERTPTTARSVAITVNVSGAPAQDPQQMQRSAAQVARSVRRALERL